MIFYTKAAGVTFEGRQQIIRNLNRQGLLDPGSELILRREPNNPYDRFAVAIIASNGQQIGYLPKDCARQVSMNMANGMRYRAFVGSVTGGDIGNAYGVNIQINY